MLDQNQFIQTGGSRCPRCEAVAGVLTWGNPQYRGSRVEIDVECGECHAQWTNSYVLSGYSLPDGSPPAPSTHGGTNITIEHKRLFAALGSGDPGFALMSCYVNGVPAAAICTVHRANAHAEEADYILTPVFVSATPDMVLTDHEGVAAIRDAPDSLN